MFFWFFVIFQFLQCAFFIFMFFSVSGHISHPTVCISHFPRFWVFLAIFQVLQFVFLFLHFFSVSRHIPCPTMWVSHVPRLSVFSPYSRFYSVCFSILYVFPRFSPYSRFYHDFLMFLLCQFSWHIQGHYIMCFSFSKFFKFLTIFQVLQWAFLIF